MSTAIIVAVLIVIAVIAIRSYAKKLTSGCCGGETEHVKKIKVEDKDVSHYPYCVQIGIDGMTCNHCKARVENTLNSEDGPHAVPPGSFPIRPELHQSPRTAGHRALHNRS